MRNLSEQRQKTVFKIRRSNSEMLFGPLGLPLNAPRAGTITNKKPKVGNNQICPSCNSGKKFKRCCGKG